MAYMDREDNDPQTIKVKLLFPLTFTQIDVPIGL